MSDCLESFNRVAYNVLQIGGRFNAANVLLYAAFLLSEKYFLKMFGNSKVSHIFVNEIKRNGNQFSIHSRRQHT